MNSLIKLAGLVPLLGLAACASTTPTISPATIRGSAQTAPADLQLLCASEAQTRFGAAADSALPIASRPGPTTGTYAVDVKLPSGQATCVIDDNGAISSLTQP